jgi:hypothetical protein
MPHVAGDYMGEHWLASFALLAIDLYDVTAEEWEKEKREQITPAVSFRWARET